MSTGLSRLGDNEDSRPWPLHANHDLGHGWGLSPAVVQYQEAGRFDQNLGLASGSCADYSMTLDEDFGNAVPAPLEAIGTSAMNKVYDTSDSKLNGLPVVVAGTACTR